MTSVQVTASYESATVEAGFLPIRELPIESSTTCREIATMLLRAHSLPTDDQDLWLGGLMVGLPAASDDAWAPSNKALMATVTADGRLNWRGPDLDTTFAELVATADAGFAPRPESGLTLILTGGYGGGGAVDWSQLLSLLEVAHDHLVAYVDDFLVLYGGAELGKRAAKRTATAIQGGMQALKVLWGRDALPDPETIDVFLDRSPRLHRAALSDGFGLSETQVDDIMRLLGYERAEASDTYTLTTAEITGLANHIYGLCEWSETWEDNELEQAARHLKARLDDLLEGLQQGRPIPTEVDPGWRLPS